MALGRWLGDYLGEWSGEAGGSSPAYVDAGFFVGGAGAAELRACIAIDAALYAYGSGASSISAALSEVPKSDVIGCWGGAWGASWGVSWGLTPVEEYARSGYWRLFYYQLQEKSLQAKAAEIARSVKAAPTAKVRLMKPKLIKPRTQVAPLPQKLALLQPFRRSTRPLPSSIFDFNLQYEFTLPAKRDKVTVLPVREPALDGSDDDVLLLLLAA